MILSLLCLDIDEKCITFWTVQL